MNDRAIDFLVRTTSVRAGLGSSLVQSGDAAGAAAKGIRLDAHTAQHGNK